MIAFRTTKIYDRWSRCRFDDLINRYDGFAISFDNNSRSFYYAHGSLAKSVKSFNNKYCFFSKKVAKNDCI